MFWIPEGIKKKLLPIYGEIGKIAGLLWQKGWAEANAGNISVDITEILADLSYKWDSLASNPLPISFESLSGSYFIITAAGSRMRDILESFSSVGIIRIGEKGNRYYTISIAEMSTQFVPTSELPSHLMIHDFLRKNQMAQKAVLHTHPTELIAVSHIDKFAGESEFNKMLRMMHTEIEAIIPEGIGYVKTLPAGSMDLAEATINAFNNHRIAIWEKHGCIAIGKTLSDAFDLVDILNKAATILILAYVPDL